MQFAIQYKDVFWTKIRMHDVLRMEELQQVDDLDADVYSFKFWE